ncbi:hypothetical protein PDIDSM_2506 [Penicillium digitatum]|nr:hypothetical protein PDIDSM_2506 [Penicillium digitatum]
MPPKEKYSDPELRDEIKKEIHNSDKGGKPGQWSARKAQMMASEYKRRGGSYNTAKEEGQTESQKHLDNWTKEEWQTKEGSGTARKDDESRKRYLPKKAWEKLSEKEKEETEEKKVEESQGGKQFVGNTTEAKEARRKASSGIGDEGQKVERDSEKIRRNGKAGKKGTKTNEEKNKDNQKNGDEKETSKTTRRRRARRARRRARRRRQDDEKKGRTGMKRSAKQDEAPKKKQKDSARMQSLRKRK